MNRELLSFGLGIILFVIVIVQFSGTGTADAEGRIELKRHEGGNQYKSLNTSVIESFMENRGISGQDIPRVHVMAYADNVTIRKFAEDYRQTRSYYQNLGGDWVLIFLVSGDGFRATSSTNKISENELETFIANSYNELRKKRGYSQERFARRVIEGIIRIATTDAGAEEVLNRYHTRNAKDMSKYLEKQAFLVSDQNWKRALSLVPVTTWTQREGVDQNCQEGYQTAAGVCTYPHLIYHQEGSSAYDPNFDADSSLYFLQQYRPNSLRLVGGSPKELDNLLIVGPGLGAGLQTGQITRMNKNNYLNYWKSYQDVVYVESNYEKALMASTYASLINSPLLIEDYNDGIDLENKNVTCVGDVAKKCDKKLTKRELQEEYIEKTDTRKVIMTNPKDLRIRVTESLDPEKSSGSIKYTHTKDSLSSPVLASAKHELLIFITSEGWKAKDKELENKIETFKTEPEYLTIISSPKAIKMAKSPSCDLTVGGCDKEEFEEIDRHIYGDFDNDNLSDLATGRIYGLTASDTSSYLARDLFYEKILDTKEFANIWKPNFRSMMGIGKKMDKLLGQYYEEESIYVDNSNGPSEAKKEDVDNKFWLSYLDHGWTQGGSGSYTTSGLKEDRIWLSPVIAFTDACSTCAYGKDSEKNDLFCTNVIRRGGVAHFGAVENAALNWQLSSMVLRRIMEGQDIGIAFKEAENFGSIHPTFHYDPFYVLLGDPVFQPVFSGKPLSIPKAESVRVKNDKEKEEISITYPPKHLTVRFDFPVSIDIQTKGHLSPSSFGEVILRDFASNYTSFEDGAIHNRGEESRTLLAFHKPAEMNQIKGIQLFINGERVAISSSKEECGSWLCWEFSSGQDKYWGKIEGWENRDLIYMTSNVNSKAIKDLEVKTRRYVIDYD